MNPAGETTDAGFVGRLFQVIKRGKEARAKYGGWDKTLAHVLPGNVVESATDLAGRSDVKEVVHRATLMFRDHLKSPAAFAEFMRAGAEVVPKFLPRLSRTARQDLRATLFLYANVIETVSTESYLESINALIDGKTSADALHAVGLMILIAVMGRFDIGDPATPERAAHELWSAVRDGIQSKDLIEDSWDTAVVCEADSEPEALVPFQTTRAAS